MGESMSFEAVVFDLFGTLVRPFRRSEHILVTRECAGILGIEFEECHRLWVESFARRSVGEFGSIAENFGWIVRRAGGEPVEETLAQAAKQYARFTVASLEPFEGVLDTLEQLRARGLRIGLLTNCAPDVPEALPKMPLGHCFDACVYSCEAKAAKPAREVYELVVQRLGVDPGRTLYVGDGSDGELAGAAAVGMHPVLVTPSLADTYDAQRPEVAGWVGERIATIPDVLQYLARR
ncbi:HAD family hydrolase [Actinospica durhamensis]|uniref:HAD family hydrolase n=1 Tax=Actinospica durhamensis TaxID=1508375 RepID=A0A941EW04_9ACTN|nr:HAD family hydrolase [Actinospica durhamensis]MBR7838840.1 HAD family hydrolase [Actinospica durhamensis]